MHKKPSPGAPKKVQIEQLIEDLEKNPDLLLEELAQKYGMSASSVYLCITSCFKWNLNVPLLFPIHLF